MKRDNAGRVETIVCSRSVPRRFFPFMFTLHTLAR